MNQQIVVRREIEEREGRGSIGERKGRESIGERAPVIRRRALSPVKHSDGEGGDGLDNNDKDRPVKSEMRFGERSEWAKNGLLGRAYQLTRFALETGQFYQSNSQTQNKYNYFRIFIYLLHYTVKSKF